VVVRIQVCPRDSRSEWSILGGRGSCVSAVMPTEINHHRSMVGRKHAVNRISCENNRLNVDQLILVAGAEKDMVDALVDRIRTGL
jgi:hypothetical protein